MSSTRGQNIFFRRLGEALAPYQLLEEVLKFYIEAAQFRIERLVDGIVPFNYPLSEYENLPLGRLITVFERHSDNKQLIERLRKAVKGRNYIAHRAVAHYMDHREKKPRIAARSSKDLKKLETQGHDLVEELLKDVKALRQAAILRSAQLLVGRSQ